MGNEQTTITEQPGTAIDDVRRIREQFERESGGDLRKHIAESNRILESLREKLGLKVATADGDGRTGEG